MTRIVRVVLTAVLVLYAGSGMAGEGKADPRSIAALMVRSGLGKQLEQVAAMVQAGMKEQNQGPKALPQEKLAEVADMAGKAYDGKVLKKKVQAHIQAKLSEADVQAALAWLSSPLGERITKLEEEAATPAGYAQMQKMAGTLTGNAARMALVRKLDAAVKATESGVAVAMSTQAALFAALTSGMAPEERPRMEDIERQVNKSRKQIRSAVEQETLLTFLYTYRGLSDAEIGKYIEFAESASGKKYHAVTYDGIASAMTSAARVLGELIVQSAGDESPDAVRRQNI